uniref:Uncharacterized protein n=1 Tax=viral metagenome TaxID=1070528 RepID=A0A6H1ZTU9_9ZZZZ
MALTFDVTEISQTNDCATSGKSLKFRYRSGWTDRAGAVVVEWKQIEPPENIGQLSLASSQATWLNVSEPIGFDAARIIVTFFVVFDTTQWLEVDDVKIE